MNRLRTIQTRVQQGNALSAAYSDRPTPPDSPHSGSPLTTALRGCTSLLKCTVFSALLTLLAIVVVTSHMHNHSRMSSISVFTSTSEMRPSRFIKHTEQLLTVHTETVQDTVVHKIQQPGATSMAVQQGSSDQQQEGWSAGDAAGGQLSGGQPTVQQMQKLAQQLAEQQLPQQQQKVQQEHAAAVPKHQQSPAAQAQQQQQQQVQPAAAGQQQPQATQAQPAEQQQQQQPQPAAAAQQQKQVTQGQPAVQQQQPQQAAAQAQQQQAQQQHPQPNAQTTVPTGTTTNNPQQLEEASRKAPPDFDWQVYLSYYPDLIAAGVTSEAMAKYHYMTSGAQERRLYKHLNVTLRYTACGGLMNQHYSHIAAISLAATLNISVALPAALSRNSFASYFSQDPSKNQVYWAAAPPSSMWDVARLRSIWAERGINIFEAPHDVALPDLSRPGTAFPTYLPPGYSWAQVARLHNIYLKPLTLHRLALAAKEQLLAVAAQQPDPYGPLLLDAPCTLFTLQTKSARRLVQQVARSLQFSPRMHALADRVISRLNISSSAPSPSFNGLHLRLEDDAADWARILGGRDKLLKMYLDACLAGGFNPQTPVYLASGLFTYGSQTDSSKLHIIHELARVSSRLLYKEQYLSPEELGGLSKEQQALVDFLVLAKAQSFVGISVSTFSYYLREYRALQGIPKASTVLVNGKRVGTDPLFEKAGRLI